MNELLLEEIKTDLEERLLEAYKNDNLEVFLESLIDEQLDILFLGEQQQTAGSNATFMQRLGATFKRMTTSRTQPTMSGGRPTTPTTSRVASVPPRRGQVASQLPQTTTAARPPAAVNNSTPQPPTPPRRGQVASQLPTTARPAPQQATTPAPAPAVAPVHTAGVGRTTPLSKPGQPVVPKVINKPTTQTAPAPAPREPAPAPRSATSRQVAQPKPQVNKPRQAPKMVNQQRPVRKPQKPASTQKFAFGRDDGTAAGAFAKSFGNVNENSHPPQLKESFERFLRDRFFKQ